jgi:hypothetical protein
MASKAEQQSDNQQPSTYDPWGKGFGNLPDRDQDGRIVRPTAQPQMDSKSKYKSFADMVGKPGGGAPLTNEKGKLKTHLPTEHIPAREPTGPYCMYLKNEILVCSLPLSDFFLIWLFTVQVIED